jgi:hypothetical protein
MRRQRHTKKTRSRLWRYITVLILIYGISTTASFLYFKPKLAFNSPFIKDIKSLRSTSKPDTEKERARLYKPQSIEEDTTEILLFKIEDTIKNYMKRYGVRLLDLYMDKDGTIYVDLSNDLRKNFRGDAYEEYLIVAGLYKELKEDIPSFKSLKILIGGKELDSFGGHIDISEPIGEEIERSSGEEVEGSI